MINVSKLHISSDLEVTLVIVSYNALNQLNNESINKLIISDMRICYFCRFTDNSNFNLCVMLLKRCHSHKLIQQLHSTWIFACYLFFNSLAQQHSKFSLFFISHSRHFNLRRHEMICSLLLVIVHRLSHTNIHMTKLF
jgi:hypothetical protein